ncbi:hypothetical protein A0J61_10718 [Choanephora cucurbitarum]|uniref:Uncharacterized protein n=1 Tax=Choanephora cucurbitarum TaxID=101091 RepID=A0A1C7MWQ6_9FUNG|nr:hypothetical protein A0J61_10718 [Choanephora cucurbitarum]
MLSIAQKTTDPIIQSLVHSFISLANEITVPSIPNLSEMHIQSSFIHPLLRGVLKPLPSLVPHCSNKFAFENDHHIMHCRPDYRVDMYDQTGIYDGTNLFGELKPADATVDDVTRDFHKCMCLGKVALKCFNYDFSMTFYSVGTSVHFYLHHSLNSHITYALHLHSFQIFTTHDTFSNYASLVPILYRLSQIFRLFCTSQPKNYIPLSSTVPYPAIKEAIRSNKKRKLGH